MVTGPRTHEWEITKLRTELAIQTKRAEEAESNLAEARARWKSAALELEGYESGVPGKGTRLWRCEHELAKARAKLTDANDTTQTLQRDLATLREALEPFAEYAKSLPPVIDGKPRITDSGPMINTHLASGSFTLTFAHFRAALAAVASKETSGGSGTVRGSPVPESFDLALPESGRGRDPSAGANHAPPREPEEGGPAREKWYLSGRGIFKQDAGSQVACAAATVNWQEDTAMMVRLLNAGEGADATLAEVRKVVAEMREWNVVADVQSWADRLDAAIGGGKVTKIDWDKYPYLAKWFRHRPDINVYSEELHGVLANEARASDAQIRALREALEWYTDVFCCGRDLGERARKALAAAEPKP
jgi:hypothetical protein